MAGSVPPFIDLIVALQSTLFPLSIGILILTSSQNVLRSVKQLAEDSFNAHSTEKQGLLCTLMVLQSSNPTVGTSTKHPASLLT